LVGIPIKFLVKKDDDLALFFLVQTLKTVLAISER